MKRLMIYSKRKLPDISGGKDFFKRNGVIIFFAVLFLCGLITGVATYFGADRERELITLFTERYISRRPVSYFTADIVINGIFFAVTMFGGVSAAGLPLIAAVPFFKGATDGILAAYLISEYSTKGYGYYALMITPGACICVFVLLYLCETCFSISGKVFRNAFADSRESINGAHVLITFGICLLCCVASCAVDLIMKLIFGGIFKL